MTIVVTGAEGFLGRAVVAALAADGHPVVAVDRVPHVGEALPGITYYQADLAEAVTLLPRESGPFTLVHLAWDMRRHLGYSVQGEQIRQFAALLDHWTPRGLQRLVAMGSAEEYGSLEGLIDERARPVGALSPYGWAKRAAHDLTASWQGRTGVPVVWLRPFIIYGPGQKGDMMIPYAVAQACSRQPAQFSDGLQQRDFIYISDVVEGIRRAVVAESSGMAVCNLGRGEPVVVAEVLKTIAAFFQAESTFALGARPRRPGEPMRQVADIRQARDLLGWTPQVRWMDGIRKVCEAAQDAQA